MSDRHLRRQASALAFVNAFWVAAVIMPVPFLLKRPAVSHLHHSHRTGVCLDDVFASTGTKLPMSTLAFAVSIGGLLYSLELDRLVSNAVTEAEISTTLGLLFDAAIKTEK